MIPNKGTWKTSIHNFGEYGVGLQLHFTFLQDLGVLFLFISLISCYCIASNSSGNYLSDDSIDHSVDAVLSLANQYGIDQNEDSLEDAEDKLDDIEQNKLEYAICDIMISIAFLFFIMFYRFHSMFILIRNYNRNLTLKDFSLEVYGIPPNPELTQDHVFNHFQKLAQVHEVALTKIYDGRLEEEKVRSDLVIKLLTE